MFIYFKQSFLFLLVAIIFIYILFWHKFAIIIINTHNCKVSFLKFFILCSNSCLIFSFCYYFINRLYFKLLLGLNIMHSKMLYTTY